MVDKVLSLLVFKEPIGSPLISFNLVQGSKLSRSDFFALESTPELPLVKLLVLGLFLFSLPREFFLLCESECLFF
jgi:hypothetical protein